jgi:hypothetical protein
MSLFEPKTPGFELLQKELDELERLGGTSLPSLEAFLQKHNLYMTAQDYKELKKIMVANKKWKIRPTHDYEIIRRGRKKK